METKKNVKKEVGRFYQTFFFMGLTISLSLTIAAFEWKSVDEGPLVNLVIDDPGFEDEVEIVRTVIPPPPPPPKPVAIKIEETQKEVEKPIDIEIDVEIEESPVEIFFEPIDEPEEDFNIIFDGIVETSPEPIGGYGAFYKFVSDEVKYPSPARRMGVEGRVFVQFVVDKDGAITDVQVIKGIGAGCDEEAARVMALAPKWNPGKQRGREVKVRMVIPILFKLN